MTYYAITVRMSDGLDRDAFTTKKMQNDAARLLEQLNFTAPIRLQGPDQIQILNFRFMEIVQKSFVIVVSIDSSLSLELLANTINECLGAINFQREYVVSRIIADESIQRLAQSHQHCTNTEQQVELTSFNRQNIPERFLCALSQQVMDTPVRLPNGSIIDSMIFQINYSVNPVNPFTNLPMQPEEVIADKCLAAEIRAFVQIEVLASDVVTAINDALGTLTLPLHSAYMSSEGNPYGSESQRYTIARSNYTVWKTVVVHNRDQQITDHYRQEIIFHPLNYPDPSHTVRALKDAYHALITQNPNRFEAITQCYPAEARKFFYVFANQVSTQYRFNNLRFMQRPHTEDASYSLEPRRLTEGARLRLPLEEAAPAAAPGLGAKT